MKSTRLAFALAALAASLPLSAAGREERRTPIVAAIEKISPSVVNISAERVVQRRSPVDLFFGGESRPRTSRSESLGSGVVIAPGVVVTNDHVISGASRIWVTTADGRELEAKLEGADADNDLAVLSVDPKGLKPAALGTTSDLMIGETVIAIGNPFGLTNTVTTGIVSAVHRTVKGESGRNYSDFLQTDAAINPGNSGGALVNILGELIGINTAIVGGANTIGFAIPIDRVRRVADDLLNYREVKTAWIGVRGTTLPPANGRPSARGQGLRVRSVWPGSPAAKAGLAPGDVVVSLDGRPVEGREDFDTTLASVGPGKTLAVVYRREGADRTARVTTERTPEDLGLDVLRRELGLVFKETRAGLMIASVLSRSPAAAKGLDRGDVVLAVNNVKVRTLDDLSRAVESGWARPSLVLSVLREPYVYQMTFGLE
ncbi:MAG TPA: trypsin-like peptidase domain-containing protein [Thermoanaerobaculia bacterium]|nr:trypsin-like peptidase domain-containing protein [Thermoanaerobaculia bacterium]